MRRRGTYLSRHKRVQRVEAKKNLAVILVIVAFAVFVFSVNAIGKFVAEKVMAPVMGSLTVVATNTPAPNATPDTSKLTQTINVPAFSLFTIQLGAYSTEDAAKTEAANVKAQGGAGYVAKGDYFRVLASGYNTKADADNVQAQLKDANKDSQVFELKCDELVFKITATKAQIDTINNAFTKYPLLCSQFVDYSASFDKGDISQIEFRTKIKTMLSDIQKIKTDLTNMGSSNKALLALIDIYAQAETSMEDISTDNQSSSQDLLVKIKYNYIQMADIFCQYQSNLK